MDWVSLMGGFISGWTVVDIFKGEVKQVVPFILGVGIVVIRIWGG